MFSPIQQSNGGLGLWNLNGLADGTYTIRLVLEDAKRGELSTFITVIVGKGVAVPTPTKPTGQPTAKPTFTLQDG